MLTFLLHATNKLRSYILVLANVLIVGGLSVPAAVAGEWMSLQNGHDIRITADGKEYELTIDEDGLRFRALDDDADIRSVIIDEHGIRIDGKDFDGELKGLSIDLDDIEDLIDLEDLRKLEAVIDLENILAKAEISIQNREHLEERREALEEARREIEEAREEIEEANREIERQHRRDRHPRAPRSHRKSHRGTIFRFGSSVSVDEDEKVRGDIIVIGGSVRVAGSVTGDVVAIGGSIRVQDGAEVYGDVCSIGGRVVEEPDAYIAGETFDLSGGVFDNLDIHISPWDYHGPTGSPFFGSALGLFGKLIRIGIIFLLGAVILMLFRNNLDVTQSTVTTSPLLAGLVGFVTQILIVPVVCIVCILLMITVIGIPVAFLLVPLSVVVVIAGFVFGFIAVAMGLENLVDRRTAIKSDSIYFKLFLGLVAITAFSLLATIIGLGGFVLSPISSVLAIVGFVVEYIAWTIGLGAVVLTLFGKRSYPATAGGGPSASGPAASSELEEIAIPGSSTRTAKDAVGGTAESVNKASTAVADKPAKPKRKTKKRTPPKKS